LREGFFSRRSNLYSKDREHESLLRRSFSQWRYFKDLAQSYFETFLQRAATNQGYFETLLQCAATDQSNFETFLPYAATNQSKFLMMSRFQYWAYI